MSAEKQIELPEVSFSLSGNRLTLRDEAGGGAVLVELDGEPSMTRATTSWFDVPMDGAVSFEVESIRFPHSSVAAARGSDGGSYDILSDQTTIPGSTFVDISAAMKVTAYIEEGPVDAHIRHDTAEVAVLEFDEPTRVVLGARSLHEEPTATMTVPDDPGALMEAVSRLGSSMKEWSAERSWPTLRGHPPAIEVGDELDIPTHLEVPDTGVTVAVPETVADVLRVAPLAYYFGADIVPGARAELHLETGHTERLGSGHELEQSVDELVARGLVLDSLVRIGGYYSLHRTEYDALAPELPFYPPELYEEPIHRQLLEYLEVPFSTIEPYVPRWSTTLTLRSEIGDATALPYSLAVLSRVRVTSDGSPRPASDPQDGVPLATASAVPAGAASLPPAGREKAIATQRRAPEDARIVLIGRSENAERSFTTTPWENYDIDGDVPSPQYRESVTRRELSAALADDPLYLHYGGEVSREGFFCSDGVLAFDDLPTASAGVVSFQWETAETAPATGLFDAAAIGCLPTTPLSVPEAEAFAKYLVLGYAPWQAAEFVGREDDVRYLGDASRSLVENTNGNQPATFSLEWEEEGAYRAEARCWSIKRDWLGEVGWVMPEPAESALTLAGGKIEKRRTFSTEELLEVAEGDSLFRFDGPVPDGFPLESVIHASREGWGAEPAPRTQSEQPCGR